MHWTAPSGEADQPACASDFFANTLRRGIQAIRIQIALQRDPVLNRAARRSFGVSLEDAWREAEEIAAIADSLFDERSGGALGWLRAARAPA